MIEQVQPADLEAWCANAVSAAAGSGVAAVPVLLDVREPWELQTASVKAPSGIELIAIPMNDVPARLGELDPARPVACLCHHGARSQRVAAFLAHNGFTDVANVVGGIDAWSVTRDGDVLRY